MLLSFPFMSDDAGRAPGRVSPFSDIVLLCGRYIWHDDASHAISGVSSF